MIRKYLEDYYNLLLEKKVDLEENIRVHQSEVDNYSNRILQLKSDVKDSLLGFSPHYVDDDLSEETVRYQNLINSSKEEIGLLQNSLLNVKLNIKELFSDIQKMKAEEMKERQEKYKQAEYKQEEESDQKQKYLNDSILNFSRFIQIQKLERNYIEEKYCNNFFRSLSSIKNKIQLSSNIIDLDSSRCKLELNMVFELLSKFSNDFNMFLYDISEIVSDSMDEENIEIQITKMFNKINNMSNCTIDFYSSIDDKIGECHSLIKYYIIYFINKIFQILVNDLHAKKINIEIELKDAKILFAIIYIGNIFNIDNSYLETNIERETMEYENKSFKIGRYNVLDDINILKQQLEIVCAEITSNQLENGEIIINIVLPL